MEQGQDLIYALDIGTRSVIGIVGRAEQGKINVLAIEREEHGLRAMTDGQIENISLVAGAAQTVTRRLEEKMGIALSNVCVAAAGRSLQTERGVFSIELEGRQRITDEIINRLEAGAVSEAESTLSGGEEGQHYYLVGYTVCGYRLDHYPLSTLKSHSGHLLEVEIVATFLPSEVVDSLYGAMQEAGLKVASLTLEPIAALNAVIPQELRLLNLVLADIGAGTTDIAVCRDGSVVGYTMTTIAGDEVTEAIMRSRLVDFNTAEHMKMSLAKEGEISFRDILGQEHCVQRQELLAEAEASTKLLAQELARKVLQLNGGAPSALFLAGGGSRLKGLQEVVAESIGIPPSRIAVAGHNFSMSAFSKEYDLDDPEYATPLGIVVSAGLGLVNDSYRVTLNGQAAKLFRSGSLSALDILMMNGYRYSDLIGRVGPNVTLTINGRRQVYHGEPARPAELRINGVNAPPSFIVHAGDSIDFVPAVNGGPSVRTVGDLNLTGRVLLNGAEADSDAAVHSGDDLVVVPAEESAPPAPRDDRAEEAGTPAPAAASPSEQDASPAGREGESPIPEEMRREQGFLLNGKPLILPPREDGSPYRLLDLLLYTGIDFEHLDKPVTLRVNGEEGFFTRELHEGDTVVIAEAP